jgi:hypothetical protein
MEFLTDNNLELLILFVAPGFISLKVWGLLNSSPRVRLSESLMEAIIYSSFNTIFFIWLFTILKQAHPLLAYIVNFIILPVLWPALFYNITKLRYFRTRLTPTAWDHYFNLGEACFVLLHLKNDAMAGGLYSGNSFASSYPEKEDLYLEELWTVDEKGVFLRKVENTKGLLVNFEEIKVIEFFKLDGTSLKPPEGGVGNLTLRNNSLQDKELPV